MLTLTDRKVCGSLQEFSRSLLVIASCLHTIRLLITRTSPPTVAYHEFNRASVTLLLVLISTCSSGSHKDQASNDFPQWLLNQKLLNFFPHIRNCLNSFYSKFVGSYSKNAFLSIGAISFAWTIVLKFSIIICSLPVSIWILELNPFGDILPLLDRSSSKKVDG